MKIFVKCNDFKKVKIRAGKAGIVSDTKKKQQEEHCDSNQVYWQQVSNMMGYKKSILEQTKIHVEDSLTGFANA